MRDNLCIGFVYILSQDFKSHGIQLLSIFDILQMNKMIIRLLCSDRISILFGEGEAVAITGGTLANVQF